MPGLYYEEFAIGQVFDHAVRRTVTEMDNVLFSALTHNPAALHLDEEYCRTETEFGQRIVNSAFTLGLMVGLSVQDTTLGTTVANLGWNEVRFPQPLFHGDTVHARSIVLEMRESKSRPATGIVTFVHEAFNQRNELVATCTRAALMKKKDKVAQ
ncbi:MaoC family dehydratase [Caballeronia sp. GAWG2-1]|uniref:MaoC family dehydratase n=1 Tax=Caballeronia sp. GAWG2-1 TaxID=2921744 RepID=UPI0020289BFB|nr:MaoC family dehydratase [Caballeronia sp. GAWG2-1]